MRFPVLLSFVPSHRLVGSSDWRGIRWTWIALGAFLAASGWAQTPADGLIGLAEQSPVPRRKQEIFNAAPGPWGRLRCSYVYMEAADSVIEGVPLPGPVTRWAFPDSMSDDDLRSLFSRAGLSSGDQADLLDAAKVKRMDGQIYVFPSSSLIDSMAGEAREVIYSELARNPVNAHHANPTTILNNDVDSWYDGSGLSARYIALIKRLSFQSGGLTLFCDQPRLVAEAAAESEARFLLKKCTRSRSLFVRLELDESTDVKALIDYWSTGARLRRKDIEPLLLSLMETAGVNRLDLVHLLPALPRKILYSYPGPEYELEGALPDCHWTSLNFFRYSPNPAYLDARIAVSAIEEQFKPVEAPYKYGDILFLMDSRGGAVHSCVFLADDIVFTKNGPNLSIPWILLKIDDVMKIYARRGAVRIQGMRYAKGGAGMDGGG